MNAIAENQNTPRQLERLAAQRQYYSDAKFWSALRLILCVIIPGILALVALGSPEFSSVAATYGVLVLFINVMILDPIVSTKKELAAQIQELFDTDVLEAPPSHINKIRTVNEEDITEQAVKYCKRHSTDTLRDWYAPDVSRLNIHIGRILCQRVNVQWDMKIRKSYSNMLFATVTVLIAAVGFDGILSHLLFEQVILTISGLSPFIQFAATQRSRNSEASERLETLRISFQSIFDLILKNAAAAPLLDQFAIEVQSMLFEHRSKSPLIPDWVYIRTRLKNEHIMNETIHKLLADILASVPSA